MPCRLVLSPSRNRIRSSLPCQCQTSRRHDHTFGLTRNVLHELTDRGFVSALTSQGLREHVKSSTCVYAGIDPSASSLHVGNLLPLMGLLHFQAAGHQSIALIGGATGSIGDPSGRSTERPILSPSQLDQNVSGITDQVHRFFSRANEYIDSHGGYPSALKGLKGDQGRRAGVRVLNNLDWFRNITFLDFLRDVGKLARVNVMLSRDSVKTRLNAEPGISFTEFSYQLLQAYDWAVLNREHGCKVQLGGSDQWGNIVAGIDLIKRQGGGVEPIDTIDTIDSGHSGKKKEKEIAEVVEESDEVYGLTTPLLTTENGDKFGKSAGNAVWLDESRTSVSDFYQFFFRTTDDRVDQYLKMFTLVPLDRIEEVVNFHMKRRKDRLAQTLLADEVTRLIHGPEAVRRAHSTQDILFRTSPLKLTTASVLDAFDSDPRLQRVRWAEVRGLPITKLAVLYGLCKSRAEATRAVSIEKCLRVNERLVADPRDEIKKNDLVDGHIIVLKLGTRQHVILHVDVG